MGKNNVKTNKQNKPTVTKRVNEEIDYADDKKVRIIGDNVESRVVSFKEAKMISSYMNKDLIEINDKQEIPIIKLENYDKYVYELKKQAKVQKQNSNKGKLKEIQLSVNIASNDLKTKANKAREFIEGDNKVKVILTMKGRELARREENKKSIFEFISILEDVAVPENMPKDEGNKTIAILKRKNGNKKS